MENIIFVKQFSLGRLAEIDFSIDINCQFPYRALLAQKQLTVLIFRDESNYFHF